MEWAALRVKVRIAYKQAQEVRDALSNLRKSINLINRQRIPGFQSRINALNISINQNNSRKFSLEGLIKDLQEKLSESVCNYVVCSQFTVLSDKLESIERIIDTLNQTTHELQLIVRLLESDSQVISALANSLSENKDSLVKYQAVYQTLNVEYQKRLLACEESNRQHVITEDVSLGDEDYLSLVTTVYHVRLETTTTEYRTFLYRRTTKTWYKVGSRGLRDLTKEQAYRLTEIVNRLRNDNSSY